MRNEPNGHYVVDARGRRTDIILSITQYQKLIEDLHDLGVLAERRDEEPIDIDEMRQRLRRAGSL